MVISLFISSNLFWEYLRFAVHRGLKVWGHIERKGGSLLVVRLPVSPEKGGKCPGSSDPNQCMCAI